MNCPDDGHLPPPSSPPAPPPPTDSQFGIDVAAREEWWRRGTENWRAHRKEWREALEQQARQQREAAHETNVAAFYALAPQLPRAAWQEEALEDTIAVFDASTAEETRRRRTEEMSRRWDDERRRQREEREAQYRERRVAIERRRRESMERSQQLAVEERQQREVALAATEAAWGRHVEELAAEADALAAAMMAAPTDEEEVDFGPSLNLIDGRARQI
nr:uncharacterized protein LOC127304284 [Lolium perenne]